MLAIQDIRPQVASFSENSRRRPHLFISGYSLDAVEAAKICLTIRGTNGLETIPFILLTRSTKESDECFAFDCGVTDYISRVVSADVLIRHIRAGLGQWSSQRIIQGDRTEQPRVVGELSVYPNSYAAIVNSSRVDLTVSEFRILWRLATHSGQMLTYAQLMSVLPDPDRSAHAKTVRFHIASLRRKLGPRVGAYLHTIRNAGYQLADPSSDHTAISVDT